MRRYQFNQKVEYKGEVLTITNNIIGPVGYTLNVSLNGDIVVEPCMHLDVRPIDKDVTFQCQKCEQIVQFNFLQERIML